MSERRRTDKQLIDMDTEALTEHARDLDAEADELRAYRDRVRQAMDERAGAPPADEER